MSTPQSELERHYDRLLRRYCMSQGGNYASLVVPSGNSNEPIHRWFSFKEGYSHGLLQRVLKDCSLTPTDSLTLLDPFSGSGTTAVSALDLKRNGSVRKLAFTGLECNPFLHLLSSAKLQYAKRGRGAQFLRFAGTVAALAKKSVSSSSPIPALSTFHKPEYFNQDALNGLLTIRDAIQVVAERTSDRSAEALALVCLAAAIEPSSGLRRDGRTLRRSTPKVRASPLEEFLRVAHMIEEDNFPSAIDAETTVEFADARKGDLYPADGSVDAAIFSPPYPNNIDYTEVYKLENWLLGFINSSEQFSDQRRTTLRSHGSLRWTDLYHYSSSPGASQIDELIQPLLDAVPADRYRQAREQLVRGYVDDMWRVFVHTRRSLRRQGLMACVVGNSLHGRGDMQLPIASDLLLARIAELLGFEILNIEVARSPTRRRTESNHIRESVIFARKVSDS